MKRTIKHFATLACLTSLSACTYNINNQSGLTKPDAGLKVVRSSQNFSATGLDTLKHKALKLGQLCIAHDYVILTNDDVRDALIQLDSNGNLDDAADTQIEFKSAKSTLKCFLETPVNGTCNANIKIEGQVTKHNTTPKAFMIEKSQTDTTMACEGAVGALRGVSAQATLAIIDLLK